MLAIHDRGMDSGDYLYLLPDYFDQGGKQGKYFEILQ
jgi:hypothetical protein